MEFSITNKNDKTIIFRLVSVGEKYGLTNALTNEKEPIWWVESNGFTLGQWYLSTIAEHEKGRGWNLHGGFPEYSLDDVETEKVATISRELLETEKVN
jgi:hypothetical protein